MSAEAERLTNRIEAIDTVALRNRERAESFERMTERLGQIEGSASSADGLVSVAASANGVVNAITFGERIRQTDPARLSQVVLGTIARARANAARAQAEVVREELGDTELLDQVLAQDERVFGDQHADPAQASEQLVSFEDQDAEYWGIPDELRPPETVDFQDDFPAFGSRNGR